MSSVKRSYALALLLLLALQFSFIDSNTRRPSYCSPDLQIDCAAEVGKKWIWTLQENNTCRPYLSECLFKQANCDYYFKAGKTLTVIDKNECPSSKCFDACYKEPKEHICAFTAEKTYPCYFANTCALSNYLCKKRFSPFHTVQYNQHSCGDDARKC